MKKHFLVLSYFTLIIAIYFMINENIHLKKPLNQGLKYCKLRPKSRTPFIHLPPSKISFNKGTAHSKISQLENGYKLK